MYTIRKGPDVGRANRPLRRRANIHLLPPNTRNVSTATQNIHKNNFHSYNVSLELKTVSINQYSAFFSLFSINKAGKDLRRDLLKIG